MKKSEENKKIITIGIIASLLFHIAVIGTFIYLFPPVDYPPLKPFSWDLEMVDEDSLPKEILTEPDEAQMKKIVEQNDKSLNDISPDKDYFLSKNNQAVAKQTRAEKTDTFKNANQQKAPSGSSSAQPKTELSKQVVEEQTPEVEESQLLNAEDGIEIVQKKKVLKKKKLNVADLSPSLFPTPGERNNEFTEQSATDDYLKDISTDTQTLLNTREFVYYTYYQRIKGKLRQYWEPKIKEKIVMLLKRGRTIASNGDKITRLVITLDDRGELKRVQLKGASGYSDLDDAAIEAFESAAPFPNPPQGIVEKDGKVRINWDFILES